MWGREAGGTANSSSESSCLGGWERITVGILLLRFGGEGSSEVDFFVIADVFFGACS